MFIVEQVEDAEKYKEYTYSSPLRKNTVNILAYYLLIFFTCSVVFFLWAFFFFFGLLSFKFLNSSVVANTISIFQVSA